MWFKRKDKSMQGIDYDKLVSELRKTLSPLQPEDKGVSVAQHLRAGRTLRFRAPQAASVKEWLSQTLIHHPDQVLLVSGTYTAMELQSVGVPAQQICRVVDFRGLVEPKLVTFKTIYVYDSMLTFPAADRLGLDIWQWIADRAGKDATVVAIDLPGELGEVAAEVVSPEDNDDVDEPQGASQVASETHYIVCACNRLDTGLLIPGVRHFDHVMGNLFDTLIDNGIITPDAARQSEQGFLDNRGVYCGRAAARTIAEVAGQIRNPTPGLNTGELFSENLY